MVLYPQFPACHRDYVTIRHNHSTQFNKAVCVVTGTYMSVAYADGFFYVRPHNDDKFYYYERSSWEPFYLIPGTDRIIVHGIYPHITGGSLTVYDNATSRFSINVTTGESRLQERSQPTFPKNRTVSASGYYTSTNGRYLVYIVDTGYANDDIFVRVDLQTGEEKEFGRGWYEYTYSSRLMPNAAISNDGRFVVAGGIDSIKLWDLSDGCLKPRQQYISQYPDHCPNRVVDSSGYGEPYSNDAITLWFSFTNDAAHINFVYRNNSTTKIVTIKPNSLLETPTLSYLAMGDSYSSGEGDIDKKSDGSSYYLPGTDTYGGCHVSERAYPFWLKTYLGLFADTMKSIACSGAVLSLDYYLPAQSYYGQHNQRKTMTEQQYGVVSENALSSFTPGVVSQIEFVRRYQPKVVTVTGGGNDVGFGEILTYCASPSWYEFFWSDRTCDYAKQGTVLNKMLGVAIRGQYDYTKLLLKKIKEVSPTTRVYVVGYPIFIGTSNSVCALNSGAINMEEIIMMQEGVKYMNRVLKQAAASEGAYYRDIENALNGGRVCEGSKYMTGTWDIKYNLTDHQQETFHPNANGQKQIADRLWQQGMSLHSQSPSAIDYQGPPPIPVSLGGDTATKVTKKKMTLFDAIKKGVTSSISLPNYSFAPRTPVSIKGYSEEVSIGEYTSDTEGGLTLSEVPLEKLPLGIHVLTVTGESLSHDPLIYYQPITIVSDNSADKDGDGILDERDPCIFIEHWYDETTGKDQCVINEPGSNEVPSSPISSELPETTETTQQHNVKQKTNLANHRTASHQQSAAVRQFVSEQPSEKSGVLASLTLLPTSSLNTHASANPKKHSRDTRDHSPSKSRITVNNIMIPIGLLIGAVILLKVINTSKKVT